MSIIDIWERFLKSLESEGGKLVVLLAMIAFLAIVSIFMVETNHTPQETGRTLIASAVSSLLGILYGYLKGK
jgi:mannitol-specific phosphotransferase system IIBC component